MNFKLRLFRTLALLCLMSLLLIGCSDNTPTLLPTATINATPIALTIPPSDAPSLKPVTPDPDLTRVAQAIATQNAIGITPQDVRQMTAVAGVVATRNSSTPDASSTDDGVTTIAVPTAFPTPVPAMPLPSPTPVTSLSPFYVPPVFTTTKLISQIIITSTFQSKSQEPVLSLAMRPDGKSLAIGGKHQIWVWDGSSGKIVQTVYASAANSDERGAYSLSWSGDGKELAAGGLHGIVMIWRWDAQANSLQPGPLRLEPQDAAQNYGDETEVAFSPDGNYLAAMDNVGTISVWDSQTYSIRASFDTEYAGHISWSPDSKTHGRRISGR